MTSISQGGVNSQGGLAVVTGAAGGLGSSFARKLADRGFRLLLADRRPEPLERLCESINDDRPGRAEPYAVDLCDREQVHRLAERLAATGDIELLVNNAGFGAIDYVIDTDAERLVQMVDLHVAAPTLLTRAVLPGLIARNRGAIVNVSSFSAWLPSAGNVQYAATKNYLVVFSRALHQELLGTNVRVQALCPGFVRTEFHAAEGMKGFASLKAPRERLWKSPDEVVEFSLRKLPGKRVVVVPGIGYRLLGRLAQMPLFQPIFQRVARGPRLK